MLDEDKNLELLEDKGIGYCGTYDAFYKMVSGKWIDHKCDNPECIFCNDRSIIHSKECECNDKDNKRLYLINGLIENHN